jgi:DNA-binding NarL/FixJ family response regulator
MDNRKSQLTRILIADDHPIFRDGLRRLLESEREFQVIGEACDGVEAVNMVRQLKPEILLLDLAMPRRPGLEALREMSTEASSVRVILLTAAAEKDQIVEALQL